MFRGLGLFLMSTAVCCLIGCGAGGGGGGGVLNQLDRFPDEDADVFSEITPPEGIAFDFATSLALRITNTITRSQAEAAAGVQVPSIVGSNVSLAAQVLVNLTYPGDISQRLPGRFPLGPFDLQFEVACPETIEVLVTVVASAPIVGTQPVTSFGPYVFTREGGDRAYTCGATVSVSTYFDEETGELAVSLDVE
jgi:hypothetical protein